MRHGFSPLPLAILPGLFLLGIVFPSACDRQDGGAVEIAWVIRGTDQRAYACNASELGTNTIETVRLTIRPLNQPDQDLCENGSVTNCEFRCDSDRAGDTLRGVTSFSIPEGTYHIGIQLLNPLDQVIGPHLIQVPEPTRKTVEKGNLTFLGVWQVVINLGVEP